VPLRERVTMPPPGKTLAIVATVSVIGAAGAAAVWWYRRAATRATPAAPVTAGRRIRRALQDMPRRSLVARDETTRAAVRRPRRFPSSFRFGPRPAVQRAASSRQKHSGPSRARRKWTGFV
jgi:hypothetical protein